MAREAPEQRVNYSFLPDCVSEVIGAPLDFSNQMSIYIMFVDTIRELLKNGFKHNLCHERRNIRCLDLCRPIVIITILKSVAILLCKLLSVLNALKQHCAKANLKFNLKAVEA